MRMTGLCIVFILGCNGQEYHCKIHPKGGIVSHSEGDRPRRLYHDLWVRLRIPIMPDRLLTKWYLNGDVCDDV